MRIKLIANAGAAAVVLLVANALSIYKPMGLTPFGRRNEREAAELRTRTVAKTAWGRYLLIGLIVLVVVFLILHFSGLHGH
jgi:hypothetical protein